ncbi:MAG: lipocalin family protein [Armatimonas sp.]
MRTLFLIPLLALVGAGCGGGSTQDRSYPLDGAFRQTRVGGSACPGSANDSLGNTVGCGSDYRITFNASAGTYRYYDAGTDTTLYQGTYYVLGATLYLVINEGGGSTRTVPQPLRYSEPELTLLSKKADSSQLDIAFARLSGSL